MQIAKLSLVAAMVLGFSGSVYAADTLADAFKNGKVNGELKAWYWDRTDEASTQRNENITNFAIELGYVTDSLYGFKAGVTFQGNATPFAEADAKTLYNKEEYASGSVLSEAYLTYAIGKTDIKVGRQYIATPLIWGNDARILKESFEGVAITNTGELPQTKVFAHYVDKFQGRTSYISDTSAVGGAPIFASKMVFGGAGALAFAFDGAYALGVINNSIQNLTFTAQYANAKDVTMTTLTDDIQMYYTEANYLLPMNGFKLGFDLNYRGSKTGNNLDAKNYEGNMLGARASIAELNGFGATLAYTTVSNSDAVIAGMGNSVTTYTGLMIRGPFEYSTFAGMDAYSINLSYNFSTAGIKGLKSVLQYINANQDTSTEVAGLTAANTHADFVGYAVNVMYEVPTVKGLSTQLIYAAMEKENTNDTAHVTTKTDKDELWFKASYKF